MKNQLVDELVETLRELPKAQAALDKSQRAGDADWGYDAQVDLRIGGKATSLLIALKETLYPRDVRQTLWRLQQFARIRSEATKGRQAVPCLVAHSISPGAKDLLRDQQVGYYDSGGSLFLSAGSIYVYVDKPAPKHLSRSIRSLFSGRSAQVLHATLMQHDRWFGVKQIAKQAQVSPATASQVLTQLERSEWAVSRGQGPSKKRRLQEPGALLDAWVKQLPVMRSFVMRRYFVPLVSTEELARKFAEACAASNTMYALTHEAAGQRYAPFLSAISQIRCRLIVGAAADEAIDALNARTVDKGANLSIIEAKSSGELLFREFMDGVWLASPIQVYLDLMRGEGRTKEMAKHLRQERISF